MSKPKLHTDRAYESELRDLKDRLLRMAGMVEQMIEHATFSVPSPDLFSCMRVCLAGHRGSIRFLISRQNCLRVFRVDLYWSGMGPSENVWSRGFGLNRSHEFD